MFEFAMNIRKSIATLSIVLVLGTALVQCVGRMALTLRVHAYVMGIQNKWLSWFAFLVCVILPVYGIAILADTIVLNSMEFWTGENPLARGANPPQKEFVREEQSGDERVVFRYGDYGRTLFGGFASLLLGVAGWVAQSTYRHTRMAALATSESLAEKNAMLETLSGKLSKYLAPQVFASIFAGTQDVKVGAKRKKLTVYFADIVDFTETTDALEAEELSHLMNEYFGHMAEIILKHGGTIDKYIGDAIMVFFGDPETNGAREDAIACVDMALEMEARLNLLRDKWLAMGVSRPLQMRAGINTGYCTVGNFGSENRMDYTIIGGQVNIAARLEQAAKPGTVLVSHQTQALVHEDFDCVEHGQIAVKGIREPVTAYRVGHSTSVGEKQMLIHEKLDGMSLVIDPNSLSAEDRNTARRYLARAIDRLKD